MHSLLRNIDDMGELRSEHAGNFTYWLTVFSSRCCGICSGLMNVMMIFLLLKVMAQARAKPEEITPFFFWWISIGWVFCCGVMPLGMVYATWRNRTNPLLFALYEKGLVIVYRNRTIHRIFWDDVGEIQRHEKRYWLGMGKAVFQGMTLQVHCHAKPDIVARNVGIPAEFFLNAEGLCNAICEVKAV